MKDIKAVLKQLNQRPIAVYPAYISLMENPSGGIFLSQILYWWAVNGDEFWVTDREIMRQTCLSTWELKAAKRKAKELGILEIRAKGIPARTHYRVIMERLIELLSELGCPKEEGEEDPQPSLEDSYQLDSRDPDSLQTSLEESYQLDGRNSPNYSLENSDKLDGRNPTTNKITYNKIKKDYTQKNKEQFAENLQTESVCDLNLNKIDKLARKDTRIRYILDEFFPKEYRKYGKTLPVVDKEKCSQKLVKLFSSLDSQNLSPAENLSLVKKVLSFALSQSFGLDKKRFPYDSPSLSRWLSLEVFNQIKEDMLSNVPRPLGETHLPPPPEISEEDRERGRALLREAIERLKRGVPKDILSEGRPQKREKVSLPPEKREEVLKELEEIKKRKEVANGLC